MMQQVLSHYHLPILACAGLILFMMVFVGALLWVSRTGSSLQYHELSQLPLGETDGERK